MKQPKPVYTVNGIHYRLDTIIAIDERYVYTEHHKIEHCLINDNYRLGLALALEEYIRWKSIPLAQRFPR